MYIRVVFGNEGFPSACYTEAIYGPEKLEDDRVNPAYPAGSVEVTEEQYVDLLANPGLRKWDGQTIVKLERPEQVPVIPDAATKLGLMRALREIGKWDAVKAAIASKADVQEEWDLASASSDSTR